MIASIAIGKMTEQFCKIEDKEKYFIQPFIEGKKVVIHVNPKASIVEVACLERIENKIKKEIRKAYQSSRFYGYPIVLVGYLTIDKKNVTILYLDDIFLKAEYSGLTQSKRYSLRSENLNSRFMLMKPELVKQVPTRRFSEQNLDAFIHLFVETNLTSKIVYRKDIPLGYEEDEVIIDDIWETLSGKVIDMEKEVGVDRKFDENQNVVEGESYEYASSLIVKSDSFDAPIKVPLVGLQDSDKVELCNASDTIGKSCRFKKYTILDKCGFILDSLG